MNFRFVPYILLIFISSCSTRLDPPKINPSATVSSYSTLILNPSNTRITFIGSALANSHQGTFTWFAGRIECPGNDPKDAKITAEIQMNSVFTKIDLLTKHLKEEDFFDVTNYPTAAFVSTKIEAAPTGDYTITGNLTLRGITKSISFPAHFEAAPKHVTLNANFTLLQSDFEMPSVKKTTDQVPVTITADLLRP